MVINLGSQGGGVYKEVFFYVFTPSFPVNQDNPHQTRQEIYASVSAQQSTCICATPETSKGQQHLYELLKETVSWQI